MKLRKAEEHEKKNYAATNPVHPLYGYVIGVTAVVGRIKTKYTIPVEYLGEGRDNPNYEAILPDGLNMGGIHTVLGFTQADLLERLSHGLSECSVDCECRG